MSWLFVLGSTRKAGNSEALARHAARGLDATDLVLVTPVNWYSVSWPMKLYLDHWSAWMRIPSLGFKLAGRTLWGVVVDSDDEQQGSADPVIDALRRTADYMDMKWGGALRGLANRPGDIENDTTALAAAETFFTRQG